MNIKNNAFDYLLHHILYVVSFQAIFLPHKNMTVNEIFEALERYEESEGQGEEENIVLIIMIRRNRCLQCFLQLSSRPVMVVRLTKIQGKKKMFT